MDLHAVVLYACAFLAASLGALAVYLRSDKPIRARYVFAELLYHGLVGAGAGALLHEWQWKDKPATIVAIAVLWGVGLFAVAELKAFLPLSKLRGIIDVLTNSKQDNDS